LRVADYTTIYSDHHGREHEAIQVPWTRVAELLGREHNGSAEDDLALKTLLLADGAPDWVEGAEGWIDECGWGIYDALLPLVALGDIAKMAGVKLDTAKKWADRGKLPEPVAHTSGGRIWDSRDIEPWLRAGRK
jgi:hypothetical protein